MHEGGIHGLLVAELANQDESADSPRAWVTVWQRLWKNFMIGHLRLIQPI